MLSDIDIALGDRVRDEITNYEGIVVAGAQHLTGCERLAVRADDDNPSTRASEEWFYPVQLLVEEAGAIDRGRPLEASESHVTVGNRVRDTVTGFEGVATTINFNLDNCPRVAVTPNDGSEDRQWFDDNRLEVVSEGVTEEFRADMADSEETKTGAAPMDGAALSMPSE